MDRRHFLFGASVAAVGAAVVVYGAPFDDMPTAAAADEERFTTRGRSVVIHRNGRNAHAVINGRHGVHIERLLDGYASHLLPFGTYPSPRKLIEALIQAEDAGLLVI